MVWSAVAAIVVSTVLNVIGVFTEDDIHWVNLLIGLAAAGIAAAFVFGVLVRRAARRPTKGASGASRSVSSAS